MFPKKSNITILEGAILVSDVHYGAKRAVFFHFLKAIESNKIETKQLILLGDIFDLLFSPIDSLRKRDAQIINLINTISLEKEIIYFEGNHDFNLQDLFPNIQVIPLSHQPLKIQTNRTTLYLAHGDYGLNLSYRVYTSIVRNRFILKLLNFFNVMSSNYIVEELDKYLSKKDHCYKFNNFEKYITNKISSLNIEDNSLFIEGHHHQGVSLDINKIKYFNLEAFACNQRYYTVQFYEEFITLDINKFNPSMIIKDDRK